MTRAVIIVETGFQDEEGLYAYHRMAEENWIIDVATPSERRLHGETVHELPKEVYGKFGVPMRITRSTESLDAKDYDVVVIPGGLVSPDMLRMRPEVCAFINFMFHDGNLVAAQCHGPWVLISAGIMRGVRATCYPSLKDDLINAGAIYTGEAVTVDGNIITADHYKHNSGFCRAVVNWIKERQ